MGKELREIVGADEPVHRKLLRGHRRNIGRFQRGNDGVVRGDLRIVPGPGTLAEVEAVDQRLQRGVGLHQTLDDRGNLREHVLGQVTRIGAGIRRRLVRLVEGLRDVEGFLHLQAEAP